MLYTKSVRRKLKIYLCSLFGFISSSYSSLGVAVIHGEQKDLEESGLEDGRQSPPPNSTYTPFELFPCKLKLFIFRLLVSFSSGAEAEASTNRCRRRRRPNRNHGGMCQHFPLYSWTKCFRMTSSTMRNRS